MMEMFSRIRAVLRRTQDDANGKKDGILTFGNVAINLNQHIVMVDGREVEMPLKEFELLRLFAENPGIVFTREKLLSNVWDMDYMGETRTVDVHISSLRTRLGEWGRAIKTVRSVGYRLEVPHA